MYTPTTVARGITTKPRTVLFGPKSRSESGLRNDGNQSRRTTSMWITPATTSGSVSQSAVASALTSPPRPPGARRFPPSRPRGRAAPSEAPSSPPSVEHRGDPVLTPDDRGVREHSTHFSDDPRDQTEHRGPPGIGEARHQDLSPSGSTPRRRASERRAPALRRPPDCTSLREARRSCRASSSARRVHAATELVGWSEVAVAVVELAPEARRLARSLAGEAPLREIDHLLGVEHEHVVPLRELPRLANRAPASTTYARTSA